MSTLTFSPSSGQPLQAPTTAVVSVKTWISVFGVLLGSFIAVLNIIVTNSSLRDIAGTLGASSDEISWVPTAYLVAEIVVIPLTAWLSSAFSLKNYLLVNSILFVIFSVCCGQARSLEIMIVFRVLQGFTGGVLIPLSFVVILQYLPTSKQPIGMALFSVTATFAPAIGETVSLYSTATHERMSQLTTYFSSHGMDPSTAQMQTLAAISGVARREAYLQVFSDCFLLLGCVLLASMLALIFMKRTAIGASGTASH